MKKIRSAAGLMILVFLCSGLLQAETDRELLVKRWKVLKHHKSGKAVPLTPNDFIHLKTDGVYEHARNNYYAKGSWALNTDELTINNNGEYKWKVVSVSESTMSLARGADEVMELEAIRLPEPVSKTSSAKVQHLCMGKWKPNEHHRGETALQLQPADLVVFFADGTYEQILNGVYSKGIWNFNKEETELTINAITWKVDTLSALFFKMTKLTDAKEFMVFAHTR